MRNKLPNIDDLRVFCVAASAPNMNEAAKRLEMTQPSVSLSLARLEKRLGVELFDRSSRPMRLTRQGKIFFKKVSQSVNDFETMVRAFQNGSLENRFADFRLIGSNSTSGDLMRFAVEPIYQATHRAEIFFGSAFEACERLITNEVDMALVSKDLPEYPQIKSERVFAEAFFFLTPKTYTAPIKTIDDICELARALPFVGSTAEFKDRAYFDRFFEEHRIPAYSRLRISSEAPRMELVGRGLGWSVLTSLNLFAVRHLINRVRVSLPEVGLQRQTFLLFKDPVYEDLARKIRESIKKGIKGEIAPELARFIGPQNGFPGL